MELQTSVQYRPLRFRVPELGGRCLHGGQLSVDMPVDRPIEVRPADLKGCRNVCEHELRILEIKHCLPEGLTVLCKLDRVIKRTLCTRLPHDGLRKPLLRHQRHDRSKAPAFPANKRVCRNAHFVKEQLRRVRRMLSDLIQLSTARESGAICINNEKTYPFCARVRIGLCGNDNEISILPAGNISFCSAYDVLVSIANSFSADCLEVRPRPGLGHCNCGNQRTIDHTGKILRFLLFRPEMN